MNVINYYIGLPQHDYEFAKRTIINISTDFTKFSPGHYKQSFFGLIFGRIALSSSVKDDKPMRRNIPTSDDMVIKEKDGNLELQKGKWVECISGYAHYSNPGFIHDFFGKMTKDEIGIFAYKHSDHHLRQFNA